MRSWIQALAIGAVVLFCACAAPKKKPEQQRAASTTAEDRKYLTTPSALRELTRNYADFYVTVMRNACDQLVETSQEVGQKRAATGLKIRSAMAAYDIATNVDPFTQLLDLVVVVTLQSAVWIDDGRADDLFAMDGQVLVDALRHSREKAWEMAKLVFEPDQLSILDGLIWDWRRRHPDIHPVTLVRFAEFADSRAKSEIAGVEGGGGLLAPVADVTAEITQMRMLAERLFYLTKRSPNLMTWQAQAMAYELLSQPQLASMVATYEQLGDSVERATKTMAELPDRIATERKAVLDHVERTESKAHAVVLEVRKSIELTDKLTGKLSTLAGESESLIAQTGKTADALTLTLGAADQLMERIERMQGGPDADAGADSEKPQTPGKPEEPAEPFRIKDYTEAVRELGKAIHETHGLLDKTQTLVGSGAWAARIKEIRENTEATISLVRNESQTLIGTVFWMSAGIFFAFFLMLGIYQLFRFWIRKRLGISSVVVLLACCLEARAGEDLPQYVQVEGVKGTLVTEGSTLGNLFFAACRDEFVKLYPQFVLKPNLRGSSAAPKALADGKCQVGVMSRPMSVEEAAAFKKKVGYDATGINFGHGPLVIWVNKYNPIAKRGLTLQELDAIFSRTRKRGGKRIRTWGDLGLTGRWKEMPIVTYAPRKESGDHTFFKVEVLAGGEFAASVKIQPGPSAIANGVGADFGGIGFAGVAFGTKRTVWTPVAKQAGGRFVEPTRENTISKTYPLTRVFYAYIDKKPGASVPLLVREFLAYCVSDEGQEILRRAGGWKMSLERSRKALALLGKEMK